MCQNAFSAYYFQVTEIVSLTGGNTYCKNTPASPLVLNLNQHQILKSLYGFHQNIPNYY